MTSIIELKVGLRLLVVISLLAFAHNGMARDFVSVGDGGGGAVPPVKATLPPLPYGYLDNNIIISPASAPDCNKTPCLKAAPTSATISNSSISPKPGEDNLVPLKTFTDKLNNLGGIIAPADGAAGNSMSGAANLFNTGIQGKECIDGKNESCSKAANSAIKTGINFTSAIGDNVIPPLVNVIPEVIDMNTSGQEAINAFYRGDVDGGVTGILEFTSKGASVILTVVNPPLGAAYSFGTSAGGVINGLPRPDGKQGGMGDYIGDKAWGMGESTNYFFNPEKDPMSPEFEKKAKQQVFENLKQQNVQAKHEADKKKQAEAAKQQNAAQQASNQQANQGFYDVLTTFANTAAQIQQMKQQTSVASSPTQNDSSNLMGKGPICAFGVRNPACNCAPNSGAPGCPKTNSATAPEGNCGSAIRGTCK